MNYAEKQGFKPGDKVEYCGRHGDRLIGTIASFVDDMVYIEDSLTGVVAKHSSYGVISKVC